MKDVNFALDKFETKILEFCIYETLEKIDIAIAMSEVNTFENDYYLWMRENVKTISNKIDIASGKWVN